MAKHELYGRRVIYTDAVEITKENVLEVLGESTALFTFNSMQTQLLYDYYRGKHAVYCRVKDVRPEICNTVVENRPNEIVSFKTGYLMGEPVQYVAHGVENISDDLAMLNEFIFSEDKATKDKDLADWFHISGTSYRMILPDATAEEDESPFEIYTLDPRDTFVVYGNQLGEPPLMGVKVIRRKNIEDTYCCWTKNRYFEITHGEIRKEEAHFIGDVPIIEYPANQARLGAFEIVIDLIDALNDLASDRMDGVEQFIQALMMFKGVDITSEDFAALKSQGAIKVPLEGDIKYLVQELNQSQTQTLADNLYQTLLDICGMPNRNGGSSTSDTGAAVILRDGWSAAETRAKTTEMMFKMSEKRFLKIALHICNIKRKMNLKLSNIEIHFTRRNYENIQDKAQVLTTMLANGNIHPELAFQHCGMFVDPEAAYLMSQKYVEEREAKEMKALEEARKLEIEESKRNLDNENPEENPDEEVE